MSKISTNVLKETLGRLIRVDWCSCLCLAQYTPARPPNRIFQIRCGRPQSSLSKAACGHTTAGCAQLIYHVAPVRMRPSWRFCAAQFRFSL